MPLPTELTLEELRARLAFWRASGVGPVIMQQSLQQYQHSILNLLQQPQHTLPEALANVIKRVDWVGAAKDLAWCEADNHYLLLQENPLFPEALKAIAQCPPFLFVKGNVELLQQPQLAMVGSRHASYYGLKATRFLVADLVQHQLVITSGLALGIDAASHQAALDFQGQTIAVLALGLDQIYPRRHQKLADEILMKQGTIISEFPIGVAPIAAHFPRRNRLISGLSLGVVIVEAQLPSGSLITAQCALEQGREVFAVPGSIFQKTSDGCHALIKQGAQCVTCAQDVLAALALPLQHNIAASENKVTADLTAMQQKVFAALSEVAQNFDELQQQLMLATSELSMILTQLLLQGLIAETWQGYVRL